MLRRFFAREEGQGLVEYALILLFIAIVVVALVSYPGRWASTVFSNVHSGMNPSP